MFAQCMFNVFSPIVSTSEIIRAERLRVVHVSTHSAVLQWRSVLSADTGYYQLRYNCVLKTEREHHSSGQTRCSGGQSNLRQSIL